MTNIFLKMWLGAMLSLLSSLLPLWTLQTKGVPPRQTYLAVAKIIPAPVASMPTLTKQHFKPVPPQPMVIPPFYVCSFSGKAILDGQSYANAKLHIRITSPVGQEERDIQTTADGTYQLSIPINASLNDPIDWEIKWETPDFKTVARSGRQIALVDQPLMTVQASLEL